jgi:hypothetical protein
LFGRTAPPYVAREQGCRLGLAGAAAPHAAFAQLAKRHGHQVGRRLHDKRVFIAQTSRQTALYIDWIMVRDVELKVRHCAIFLGIEATAASALFASSDGKPTLVH